MLRNSNLTNGSAVANHGEAMGAETISKNGECLQNQRSRGNFLRKVCFGLLVATIVALGMGLSACGNTNAQQRSSANAPERWEYMVIANSPDADDWTRNELTQELNKLGTQGWELVSFGGRPNSSHQYIFKRRL